MTDPQTLFPVEPPAANVAEQFDQWWALWTIPGTKRARGHARKAFLKALKVGTYEELRTGVTRYMEWCNASGQMPEHIKHPATWLNAESWADDLVVADPFASFR